MVLWLLNESLVTLQINQLALFLTGVSLSKFSRIGRLAVLRKKILSTYPCGRVAATPKKPLTPIVGSLLYVTPILRIRGHVAIR